MIQYVWYDPLHPKKVHSNFHHRNICHLVCKEIYTKKVHWFLILSWEGVYKKDPFGTKENTGTVISSVFMEINFRGFIKIQFQEYVNSLTIILSIQYVII